MIAALAALALSSSQPGQPIEPCVARHAQRTTVEAIAADPQRWIGRCVTVAGPATGTAVFSGIDGIYVAHRGPGGRAGGPPAAFHRVGLYSREVGFRARYNGTFTYLTLTGTVDSCARMRTRAEAGSSQPTLVTLGGFCHWQDGPVINVASYRADPSRRIERLSGERARRRFGSYREAPGGWVHLAALRSFASDFLAALRSGDRPALSALHADSSAHPIDEALVSALLDSRSVSARIRDQPLPQMAIFVPTAPQSFAFAPPGPAPEGMICFCRTGDCSQRWPIAWGEADNDPSRPYACTFVAPADWLARGARLNTMTRRQGLAEPRLTAFRRPSESVRR